MEKIRRALTLAKTCWKVLMLDKELLVFPLLSFLVLAFLSAAAFSPFFVFDNPAETLDVVFGELSNTEDWVLFGLAFSAYFVAYFVIIFFNSALVACVNIRLAGGNPTLVDGLRSSIARLPQILAWALVTSTVGFILSQIESKSKGIPKFFLSLLGVAWAVASYFVVPVLVTEKIGPFKAIKRSGTIIRKSWGEAIISVTGMSVLSGFAVFASFGVAMLGIPFVETAPEIALILFLSGIALGVTSALVFSTLGAILKAALYAYAVEGKVPTGFDDELITGAFSDKQRS